MNGYKFARQVPLGVYIVEFSIPGMVVEIDGFHHADNMSDEARTQWLNGAGYSVLRFWNREITKERRAVLEMILAALEKRLFQRDDILRFYPAIVHTENLRK
ncbi:endonuclease domain-containing protein [Rhizobium mulingense]|uniref:endonuclease domain-containing protein n=1 Tax=Rhizobium mulingense TaxID=3031128 RepID=UPI003A7F4932